MTTGSLSATLSKRPNYPNRLFIAFLKQFHSFRMPLLDGHSMTASGRPVRSCDGLIFKLIQARRFPKNLLVFAKREPPPPMTVRTLFASAQTLANLPNRHQRFRSTYPLDQAVRFKPVSDDRRKILSLGSFEIRSPNDPKKSERLAPLVLLCQSVKL